MPADGRRITQLRRRLGVLGILARLFLVALERWHVIIRVLFLLLAVITAGQPSAAAELREVDAPEITTACKTKLARANARVE